MSAPTVLGDKCLFSDAEVRRATVKALSPVAVIVVSTSLVRDTVGRFPKNQDYYKKFCNDRMQRRPTFHVGAPTPVARPSWGLPFSSKQLSRAFLRRPSVAQTSPASVSTPAVAKPRRSAGGIFRAQSRKQTLLLC